MKIQDWLERKQKGQKISMLTCYDSTFAKILNATDVDALLVGDSAAMVMHGYSTTIQADLQMMAAHTSAVAKSAPKKFIVGDMPFLSYRKSLPETLTAVEVLMKAGAHAIKLEGIHGHFDWIKHIVQSGVPVMGHIGLTPQSIHTLGGFKVQGKDPATQEELKNQASLLEEAGCFSLVLECIPSELGAAITRNLSIPTIGIGAGPDTDGQVLVLQDMLGMNTEFHPKFLRHFADLSATIQKSCNDFHQSVQSKQFPSTEESYL